MSNRTAVANGADPIQQQAASDGNAVQDACNLVAVVERDEAVVGICLKPHAEDGHQPPLPPTTHQLWRPARR